MAHKLPLWKLLLIAVFVVLIVAWIRLVLLLTYGSSTVGEAPWHADDGESFQALPRIEDFEPMVGLSSLSKDTPRRSCYRKTTEGQSAPLLQGQLTERNCKKRLPNIVVIGAKHCGTNLLQFYLQHHPFVELPPNSSRYLYYFKWKETFYKGANWFRSQMPYTTPNQMTVHVNPSYLNSEYSAGRMKYELTPLTKFIVVLCEPIGRLVHEYEYMKSAFGVTPENETAELRAHPLTYPYYDAKYFIADNLEKSLYQPDTGEPNNWNALLNNGMYVTHLRRWFHYFDLDRFFVAKEEWIARRPYKTLRKIENFIGLPSFFQKRQFFSKGDKGASVLCVRLSNSEVCPAGYRWKNETEINRSINQTLLEKLRQFFKPYNLDLSTLLSRDFISWSDSNNFGLAENETARNPIVANRTLL